MGQGLGLKCHPLNEHRMQEGENGSSCQLPCSQPVSSSWQAPVGCPTHQVTAQDEPWLKSTEEQQNLLKNMQRYQNPQAGKSVYFFVVWSFLLFGLFGCFCVAVWSGACSFFCCLGGGPGPAQTAKKITHPRPNSKKKTRPRPFRACLSGRGGCVCFLLFGPGSVFFFLLFGRGACSFCCCLGGGRVFFCLGRGACSFFCCLGGGVFFFFAVWAGVGFFFAVWAGDGSSLTYRSAWLVFERPNNKKDQTAKKKKHGFPLKPCRLTSALKPLKMCFKTSF